MSGFIRLPQDEEERIKAFEHVRNDENGSNIEAWIEVEMGIEPDGELCRAATEHLVERFDSGEQEVDLASFILNHIAWRQSNS